ncbi:MAG: bifunctional methylenetetrahydrofolate dehydrogenase/methenyltetrahydrofolate cyclohydrolase FolD [Chlorobium sp.]|jgi:methylenetetrahydrofolate dehydrogenase (NADP+)/methenyltetrahydrofolate cyclohydrolase|uniref:bifunctional methylenetetrahydrofolate dehydrogenase/methenyltetrahydrofolate cyclohydrolase FolD n=1 Tax=Chlorobium sp. TaxID=1095 RepID=UPI0025C1A5A5|nr:bifunctional methylenetetrahydrofolate dehydrogenase/methenyltetrahydrofolate cyclohydrolase FolD [Chlorobium sp.]MCF8215827.1 bifunctional methylenetetrahydrofolate dehydrogenase/methenyltetrahydrofolate cyclohydrolase FolD [Chlorobium sp.]MCF8270725.1 bifunctional methylenetetrahydrofolate dehydrogenase/methenyltetrahydrofolate cyclohydrolase FolD [Chlorobium sp.]MCF8287037.1 bifunctional methylenetetrahydrofolate dehydrogenase/methenyltetrahydrofolate cyclohydrolase FolD [Chlorobium sp.]M
MLIIDGKKVSSDLKTEMKVRVDAHRATTRKVPGLTVIIVGEDPASQVYVRNKAKSCVEVGMNSSVIEMPASTSQEVLLAKIHELNANPDVHGILVQQPLPKQIDEFAVTMAIDPAKDVDGFHPENLGKLVMGHLDRCFVSCTPYGILELLGRYNIETKGKHCVVVGRSNIVGKPMANLMLQKLEATNCTVTICHSATKDIPSYTRQADILIAAIGKARFITADMVKPGAVVIDVGINRIDDPSTKSGTRLVGDVDYEGISPIASAMTPVPGGVGPMTIAMLLKNTLQSFERVNGLL